MTGQDYIQLLMNGLVHHQNHFKEYLIREKQKAAENYIYETEFLDRLVDAINFMESELHRQARSLNKEAKLNIEVYSQGRFTGFIDKNTIASFDKALNEAFHLYRTADSYMIIKPIEEPEPSNTVNGRPGADPTDFKNLLINISSESKEALKELLQKNFSEVKPKEFVHLLLVLNNKGYLYFNTRKELYVSVEQLLGKRYGSISNKNQTWNNPDPELLQRTEKKLNELLHENVII